MDTPCMSEEVVFYCPWYNSDSQAEPLMVGSSWQLRCAVCGVAPFRLFDVDIRKGYILLDLQFGPNWRDGNFYEDTILGYGIFLCDTSFNRLGNKSSPVAEVAAARVLPDSEVLTCCKDSYY